MQDRSKAPKPADRWRLLRHPADRGEGRGRFDAAAEVASNLASSGLFFSIVRWRR